MKTVTYSKAALKALRGMPGNVAEVIRAKIEQYAVEPASLANMVVKLQGREGYRLRVGEWRVLFTEDSAVIAVIRIAPRGSAYQG